MPRHNPPRQDDPKVALKHTHRVQDLIRQGRLEDAKAAHNKRVNREMHRSRTSKINLADLTAAKRELDAAS